MDYEKFKQLIKREMMSRDIWKDTYTFQVNKNIRGQSKSIFILNNDKKKYIAKYFNYTDVKVNIKMYKKLKIKMYKKCNQLCIGSDTSESIFNLSFKR